jgi:hypothetical protein
LPGDRGTLLLTLAGYTRWLWGAIDALSAGFVELLAMRLTAGAAP